MNVLFLSQPEENNLPANQPDLWDPQKNYKTPIEYHMPKLGLLYLAGHLEKHSSANIKTIDCSLEHINYEKLKEKIKKFKPDIVAMTALSFTLVDAIKSAKIIKQINPQTKIVFGGAHTNIYPKETLMVVPELDYIIFGEGEITFTELVKNIGDPEKIKNIKGLIYRQGDEIINTGKREPIADLNSLPFPARHLTLYKKYASMLTKEKPVSTMITSRGCPFGCRFCDRPHLGRIFRQRSAENVVREMELCKKMGIKEILIYDDTFTIDRQRVVDICKLLLKKNLKIKWDIRTRIDTVDFELLKLMKKAGCTRIHYGVEAGTDKILKVLNKGITIAQVIETFKITKKAKIQTLAYFMIGNPNETPEDISETLCLAKKLKPRYIILGILTPFPATEIYLDGLKKGIIKEDYWKNFALHPDSNFKPPFWPENFSRQKLINLLYKLHQKFYLQPRFILREVLKLRSAGELKNKFKIFLKLISLKNQ